MLVGLQAYCTTCGARRSPLAAPAVNVAGKGMKVGGQVVRFAGCGLLAAATMLSLAIVLPLLFFTSVSLWWLGFLPLALALPFGFGLLFGGKKIQEGGQDQQDTARVMAIVALAQHRGGAVTVDEVVRHVQVPRDEAERLLDRLVKYGADARHTRTDVMGPGATEPLLRLEVDDEGTMLYALPGPLQRGKWDQGGLTGERLRATGQRFEDVAAASARAPSPRDAEAEREAEAEAEAERARARGRP